VTVIVESIMNSADIATRYSRYVESHEFDQIGRLMSPHVQLRALLPRRTETWEGPEAAVAGIAGWFTPWGLKLLEHRADNVAGRYCVVDRFDARQGEQHAIIEQHVFWTIGASGIETMDLLCSGFRPIVIAESTRHRFDAGDLGCGDGLAAAFRRQVDAIPPGAILEVITSDPAAREDLPPLARMTGHTVLDVQHRDDGRTVVTVEKKR